MSTPDWLTQDAVERALRISSDTHIRVSNIALEPLSDAEGGSSSSSSTVSRLTAWTSEGEKNFVVKTLPTTGNKKKFAFMGRTYRRETAMYQSIIPELTSMLQGLRDRQGELFLPSPFAPNHVYSGKRPKKFILLEDIRKRGYSAPNSHLGLDLPHSLLAVRALAVFHAASAAYLVRKPQTYALLENPYDLLLDYIQERVQHIFPLAIRKCREEDSTRELADVIETLIPTVALHLAESNCPADSNFNVICHGDFWIKNLMFRNEGDAVKDVCFIDFQMSHAASPVIDLLLFVVTSLSAEVFFRWGNELIEHYYTNLGKTLLTLQTFPPSREMINEALKTYSIVAVHAAITIMPVARVRLSQEEKEALNEGEYDFSRLFECEAVTNCLYTLLREMAAWGWIDIRGSF